MCKFFSLVSNGKGFIYYFDEEQREQIMKGELNDKRGDGVSDMDSHTSIMAYQGIHGRKEDKWNRWEYDVNSQTLECDTLNTYDDREKVKDKIKTLDFTKIKPMSFLKEQWEKELIKKNGYSVGDIIQVNENLGKCKFGYNRNMQDTAGNKARISCIQYSLRHACLYYKVRGWALSEDDFTPVEI